MIPENNKGAEPWPASAPFIDQGLNTSLNISPIAKISNHAAAEFLKLIAEDEQITFQTLDDKGGNENI